MRIEVTHLVPAPRAVVWSVVGDPPAMAGLLDGLSRFDHAGGPDRGCGARYRVLLRVGSADLGGLVEFVEWEASLDCAWATVLGLDTRLRWRLRDGPGGGTRLTLRLAYQAPGFLLGRVAEVVAVPLVRRSLRASVMAVSLEAQRRGLPAVRPARRRITTS